jgi:hypothetical protein
MRPLTKIMFLLLDQHILLISEIGATWELKIYVQYILPSLYAGSVFHNTPAYQDDEGGIDLIFKEVLLK